MIVIKTTCDTCGEISVPLTEVALHVNTGSRMNYFSFVCPSCGELKGGEAEVHLVTFLISQGVPPDHSRFAPEVLEAHAGGPISYDDVLDFHFMLEDASWLKDLKKSLEAA